MTRRNEGSPQFERALEELEGLVQRMEQGELTLEESLRCFERGVELTRQCQQSLLQAEQKVQMLLEKDGHPVTVELDGET